LPLASCEFKEATPVTPPPLVEREDLGGGLLSLKKMPLQGDLLFAVPPTFS
jgi:hypothetical protein